MKMKEYIKDSKIIDWDFTNEFAYNAYKELNNPFDKYFIYRTPKYNTLKPTTYSNASNFIEEANEKYGLLQDPDAKSELLQEIYKTLWPDLVNQKFMLKKDRVQSDTMTSAQHSLKVCYKGRFFCEVAIQTAHNGMVLL